MKNVLSSAALSLTLLAGVAGISGVAAAPRTGWVDVNNKPIQLQAIRQSFTGATSPITIPVNQLPPSARDLFTTPVGGALNDFWKNTASGFLCNQAVSKLNGLGKGSFHIYGAECHLPEGGSASASQQDDKVVINYHLPNNVLEAYVTTPGTCAPGHGTIFCPVDPKFSLTADIDLQATIEAPGLACDLHVDPFTVRVSNVVPDSQNWTADVGLSLADFIGSLVGIDVNGLVSNLVTSSVDQLNSKGVGLQQGLMGKVDSFTSALCKSIIPHIPGAGDDIWMLSASVDPVQGIVLKLTDQEPTPSLFRAEIHTDQATVTAGSAVTVSGQYFPQHGVPVALTLGSTQLGTATISDHGTFSATVTIPAGTPAGSATIRATAGSAAATTSIQVVAKGSNASMALTYQGHTYTNIAFGDTDTLAGLNFTPGSVTVYVDSPSGFKLGTATVAADGTFKLDFSVTADQAGHTGERKLVAVQNGAVQAQLTVNFVYPEVIH